ncbi:AIPR family protein [Enterobacter quasiroggenkampii]|uniref:AIPR family protein n=1 Tax=Enterobacter quasiroggenkampii TaxID=2497436 RepID=UPI0021D0EFBC|nr:AIPR family protein [Enterobacter quasiroggenkampii]MCU6329926.1 AIPR family protein [Enterobacter quasiroggenkampii]
MAFVVDIRVEDNAVAAPATAQVTAQRLGSGLRERFEGYIHKRECQPGQQDYNTKMASRALAAFTLYQLGGVDDKHAGESVCDSSGDGGIDGVVVNHSDKVVVVVQSKFNQAGNGTWTRADFMCFKDACEKLQNERYDLFDQILQDKSSDISTALNSFDYKFIFAMTHTGKKGASEEVLRDMKEWQTQLNAASFTSDELPKEEWAFQVHLISSEDLVHWLQAGSRGQIDLTGVEVERYGYLNEPFKAFYGTLSGDQIASWWKQYGTRLFTKNLRNMLGKTDVNEEIKKSAIENPNMFWFYNNGITILVNEVIPHRRNTASGSERGIFDFKDVSIINGAQTVSSIGSVMDALGDNIFQVKVSTRFIEVREDVDNNISNAITRANNFQNRVLGRDFASQQPDQHRLARELILEGYQYQLLRTDEDYSQTNSKVIDLDEALNALACLSKNSTIVATLKSNRGRFFENFDGTLYKTVFNPRLSGSKLINAVNHFRVIERAINDTLSDTDKSTHSRRHLIITHGNRYYASVLLNSINNINNSSELLNPDIDKLYDDLFELIDRTEDFIERNYPNAYPARFFANPAKIQELYENI